MLMRDWIFRLNNNEQSRPSSRSSSLASSGTYTSTPSTTCTASSTSASSSLTDTSSGNQKMLKIKFFGGNKDKVRLFLLKKCSELIN